MSKTRRIFCLVLAVLTAILSTPAEAKNMHLTAEEAHRVILKQGPDKYIMIQDKSGLRLVGRTALLHADYFDMQVVHEHAIRSIPYSDIDAIWTGAGWKTGAVFLAVPVALGVTGYLVWRHEKNQTDANYYNQCIATFTVAQCIGCMERIECSPLTARRKRQ